MRTTRLLIGAMMLATALGASTALAQEQREVRPLLGAVSYFPLGVGHRWVYERAGAGGTSTWTVAVAETAYPPGPWRLHRLDGYFPGAPRWVRADRGGTVTEVLPGAPGWYLWYQLAAPPGASWQLHLAPSPTTGPVADCVDGSRLAVASRDEVVDVPAGRFTRVVRIDFHSRCADAGITSEWFAPGVGLVRRAETSIAGPVVSELVMAELDGQVWPRATYAATLSLDRPQYVNNLMPPLGPDALPTIRGSFALRNLTDVPLELTFSGCKSATVEVANEAGEVMVRASADDGGCCTCENLVTVPLTREGIVLPLSFKLSAENGDALPDGRYSVTVTLDTTDDVALRPSARVPIVIASVY